MLEDRLDIDRLMGLLIKVFKDASRLISPRVKLKPKYSCKICCSAHVSSLCMLCAFAVHVSKMQGKRIVLRREQYARICFRNQREAHPA